MNNDEIELDVESPYMEFKSNDEEPKVGFTCGAFDLLHEGHALMLEEARTQCEYLIVGVQSDPSRDRPEKNSPIMSHEERITMVRSIRFVDEVITYDSEEDLYRVLVEISPDIRILGSDWKGKDFTGKDLNIEIY